MRIWLITVLPVQAKTIIYKHIFFIFSLLSDYNNIAFLSVPAFGNWPYLPTFSTTADILSISSAILGIMSTVRRTWEPTHLEYRKSVENHSFAFSNAILFWIHFELEMSNGILWNNNTFRFQYFTDIGIYVYCDKITALFLSFFHITKTKLFKIC